MPDQTPRTFSISSINGFGSKTYGKTDFAADGSYITTCWVIACYVPLIPTESWRAWEIVEKKRLFGLIPYTDNSNFYASAKSLAGVPIHPAITGHHPEYHDRCRIRCAQLVGKHSTRFTHPLGLPSVVPAPPRPPSPHADTRKTQKRDKPIKRPCR